MKILLLFPPSWHPSQPYLSLPSLTAFLKREGIRDVTQRDLNIEFLEVLLSWEKMKAEYEKMEDWLKKVTNEASPELKEKYEGIKKAVEWIPNLVEWVERAKKTIRSSDFYNIEKYTEALKVIDKWLELITAYYWPSQITTLHNDMRYSVYSSGDIMAAIKDVEENIFLNIFKDHFMPSILEEGPGLVGISITSTSQIIPGFTLARLIKEKNSDIHITIGGSIFTKLADNLLSDNCREDLFSIVDSFVIFEGEHALLSLIEQMENGNDLSKVPNLIYKQNGKTVINEPLLIEDLNYLPTPDYDGFPLHLYHTPQLVLPIQTSRGCYWRKCTFCNLHLDHRVFRPRNIDLVMEDINNLSRRHKTKFFFITDESIPLNNLRNLSERIVENSLDIKWITGVRLEKKLGPDLIEKAAMGGCLKFVFGLESYNQRVLDMMQKGIHRDTVNRIIEDCLRFGVAIHLYIIVGFPTEKREEAFETMDFILGNDRLCSSSGFSCLPSLFELEKGSPIMDSPNTYRLTKIMEPKGHDLSLGYSYEVNNGMTPQEAEEVYGEVIQRINARIAPFPYNYSMSDGLLYIAKLKEI